MAAIVTSVARLATGPCRRSPDHARLFDSSTPVDGMGEKSCRAYQRGIGMPKE